MILGMILPRENNPGGETGKVTRRILPAMSITPLYIGIKRIQLHPGISLVVCSIPYPCGCAGGHERPGRRLKRRLDRILAEEGVLSVIEHPAVKNLYGSHKARYESCLIDIAVSRFTELLGMAYRGTGLGRIEVTITGSQRCLEYAITRLVPLVKTINVLIPDGFQELLVLPLRREDGDGHSAALGGLHELAGGVAAHLVRHVRHDVRVDGLRDRDEVAGHGRQFVEAVRFD